MHLCFVLWQGDYNARTMTVVRFFSRQGKGREEMTLMIEIEY
jgi:hypothetical protein